LRYEPRAEITLPAESNTKAAGADVLSLPVLVLEDKVEMMMMYRSYLKNSGFHLIPASTIREAQEALDKLSPKAVVLDVMLRSEDSWRLLAEIRQEPGTRNIPVLIVSTIEDQAKAFHLGADDYLVKPLDRVALLERLTELTGAKRILIIDDDERDRYLLKQQLRESALMIQEASDGLEGIRKASQQRPNAIMLDLTMPGMNGFEVLDALKAAPATKDIPVVICTSRVLTEQEKLQLEGKTAAILSKEGYGHGEIAATIRRTVGLTRLPAAAI
jgi:CheY-like chemotaxis protein